MSNRLKFGAMLSHQFLDIASTNHLFVNRFFVSTCLAPTAANCVINTHFTTNRCVFK